MNEKYRVYSMETKKDIAMEYAEFILGVNDGDLEVPINPNMINIGALFTNFLEPRLHCGDMRLGVSVIPTHFYEYNYSNNKNTRRRGIKVTCNLGDCDWEGQSVDHESYCHLWKEAVLETAKSLMTYLSQDRTKVYFRGKHDNILVVKRYYC